MSCDDMPERPTQPPEPWTPGPSWPDPTDADREAALTDLIGERMELRLSADIHARDGRDEVHEALGDVLSVTDLKLIATAVADNDSAELGRLLMDGLHTHFAGIFGDSAIEERAEQFRDQRMAKARREAETNRDYAADMQHQRAVDARLDHEQENAA